MFESTFIKVLTYRYDYLNLFNRYIYNNKPTVFEITSIFIIWLSKYVKHKISAFLLDFLAVFLYVLWTKNQTDEGVKQYIADVFINEASFEDMKEVEQLYYLIYGQSRIMYFDSKVLISHLVDYFMGNGLLVE